MEKDKVKSKFQFLDSYVTKSEIIINNRNLENTELKLEIELKFSELKKENNRTSAQLKLTNKVSIVNKESNKNCVDIDVEMAGIFGAEGIDDEEFVKYMKYSGTPIISQAIRSYVMNLSAMSGIDTVRIPLLNYMEFFKDEKEN